MRAAALLLTLLVPLAAGAEEPAPRELLAGAKRILFLGDSNTYAGEYVAGFDAWLEVEFGPKKPPVVNCGLPSETVSGLSEEGHAGGAFPRPDVHERLTRVLDTVRPDLVFACYGMNCAIYLPLDEERLAKYEAGIRKLKEEVEARGATLVLLTPPCYDDQRLPKEGFRYNDVLGAYARRLLAQREAGQRVIDLHAPMTAELARRRESDPEFTFQPDAVHPNAEGHWFVARQLLAWAGDEEAAAAPTPEAMLAAKGASAELLPLVRKRLFVLRDAYLGAAGHQRPGIAKGLPIPEAEAQAAEWTAELRTLAAGEE